MMIIWVLVIVIAVVLGMVMDISLQMGWFAFLDLRMRIYYDIVFLLIALALLYRISFLQKKGEKEKLRERVKELENKIKEMQKGQ